MAQLGARLDGIEEVVGSNPIGSTNFVFLFNHLRQFPRDLRPTTQTPASRYPEPLAVGQVFPGNKFGE